MTSNEAAQSIPSRAWRTVIGVLGSLILTGGCYGLAGYAGLATACGATLILTVLCAQIEAAIRGVP